MSELIEKLEPGERLTFIGGEYPGGLQIVFRRGDYSLETFVSYETIKQHRDFDGIAFVTSRLITTAREKINEKE